MNEKTLYIMKFIGCIIITTFFLFLAILMLVLAIDDFTSQKIGTERVKCIDRYGAEFVDEWCEKDVYCSALGFAGSERCEK